MNSRDDVMLAIINIGEAFSAAEKAIENMKKIKRVNPIIKSVVADYAQDHVLTLEQRERIERRVARDAAQREKNKNTLVRFGFEMYPPRVKGRSKRGWTVQLKG